MQRNETSTFTAQVTGWQRQQERHLRARGPRQASLQCHHTAPISMIAAY